MRTIQQELETGARLQEWNGLPPLLGFFHHLRTVGIAVVDPTADFRWVTGYDGKTRYILDLVSYV